MGFFQIQHLNKSFGNVKVADDISFSVEKGEFVGIIGPNGAGKTTLFHMITGIVTPTSGEIFFKDEKITGLPIYRIVQKGLSRTFQIPRPFKELTILDNIKVANPSRNKAESLADRAEQVLRQVGLWEQRDQLAGNLPQGDLRRLEVARALATSPELLLLDEPFAGLNTAEVQGLMQLCMKLHQEGLTIIIVEHKLKELMQMVQRVIAIDFGKLIADDTPEQVVKNERVLKAYLGDRRWDLA
ncbi:MAG: hypothetical protein BAA01_11010 [Bacillus thermozeamaize]|jgi:branched-chain amino acid transport system ATP-binding protein|uniref:ABC transporter domain-containing protein n=1 Tax=Bacillus thermozeamaize TaxID=230954 RepID=A0A1Y3PLL7_9BACI|nr:MAG: hypothetical protein BAA01_11010 [Bacillus thermozeamaize]